MTVAAPIVAASADCGCGGTVVAPPVMNGTEIIMESPMMGGTVISDGGMMGDVMSTTPMEMSPAAGDTSGYNLNPGEQLVPGSVRVIDTAPAAAAASAETSAEPAADAAPAATTEEAPTSASDTGEEAAPPAPTPDPAASGDEG